MWDLTVSVPDHCLSFYFVSFFAFLLNMHPNISELSNRNLLVFVLLVSLKYTCS